MAVGHKSSGRVDSNYFERSQGDHNVLLSVPVSDHLVPHHRRWSCPSWQWTVPLLRRCPDRSCIRFVYMPAHQRVCGFPVV